MDTNGISAALMQEADTISASCTKLPLPIGRICFEQGIQIGRKSGIGEFKAHMTLPRNPDDFAHVFLPEREPSLKRATNYERFCLAHELGHLIIFRRFAIVPAGKSEYWQHEAICDDFARTLLLPGRFLPPQISLNVFGDILLRLTQLSRIPVMQVAKRLSEAAGNAAFFRIKIKESKLTIFSTTNKNGKLTSKSISGILKIRIEALRAKGLSDTMVSLSGLALIDSGLIGLRPSEEYQVGIWFGQLKDECIVCIVEDRRVKATGPLLEASTVKFAL